MTFDFRPPRRHFLAKVPSFDRRASIDAAAARTFEEAIARYAVPVFRAQQVDDSGPLASWRVSGRPVSAARRR